MSDEIEALLQRVESDNAAIDAKLAERRAALERAHAEAKSRRTKLQERLGDLQTELAFTEGYLGALEGHRPVVPTPRRTRRQILQLTIRSGIGLAVGAAAGLLHAAGLSNAAVAGAVALPVLAFWFFGDHIDALESRHG